MPKYCMKIPWQDQKKFSPPLVSITIMDVSFEIFS